MKLKFDLKFFLLLTAILGLAEFSKAQFGNCMVDSVRKNPFNQCGSEYYPVCGCDGVTYRNLCASYWQGGLDDQYTQQGVCGNFDFDFFPNPLSDQMNFRLYVKDQAYVTIQIVDIYGKTMFFNSLFSSFAFPITYNIPTSGFKPGIYVVLVSSKGESKQQKFVKM